MRSPPGFDIDNCTCSRDLSVSKTKIETQQTSRIFQSQDVTISWRRSYEETTGTINHDRSWQPKSVMIGVQRIAKKVALPSKTTNIFAEWSSSIPRFTASERASRLVEMAVNHEIGKVMSGRSSSICENTEVGIDCDARVNGCVSAPLALGDTQQLPDKKRTFGGLS